ncbi:amino acid ABC transporter permease [Paenibacillus polymyxa]|uniref:Amino acid ABC transporter permease n=1 Tax=Paenibacillus polymyxa TaxID=1406 RepID=A0A378Y5W2_PAEPO|nr:amino acid ABC transporter permease [Paenibacillus polymyxa]KJD40400.1 amino acid ABC transporter permease [Paenibacillus polymyxa]MBE7898856.1 amino acid ABC transporter permease [Paenibacillus polymyxa]MBG9762539.1 amino acid ABC transporter permease [Paenibacillus polymyxa]MCC3261114.1 amino acid ABC transporter permease [Paenibacillus polymyxa]MEE4563168.1 amino acid ABC transporter permease [Paenibacillus polymyxa]
MLSSGINVLFEGSNFERLLGGLLVTLEIALLSIIIGTLLGILMGLLRTLQSRPIRFVLKFYLETFRIIPILVWLYVVYFGFTPLLNVNISGELTAVIVFSLWGAAEIGDIVRGALESLPKHQVESGQALGLTYWQLYRHVLIPQAVRRMLPGSINLATRMIKTTSLVVLIGVVEVVKVGQQIIELGVIKAPSASFWVYGFIFILYFLVCYPLSRLSKRFERRWQN